MESRIVRAHSRALNQLRPITITYNAFGYAPGSVLFELGNTKVLCSITLQQGVPPFLKGKKEGWLTAEYSLLPTSTINRSMRDGIQKRNDRSIEISRLIGRSLRAIVDLTTLGERTIIVDCDILQADGSTRTAAITGAYLALQQAMNLWLAQHDISTPFIREPIAAVSVGCASGTVLLDLDYQEDSVLDVDYNVVLTQSGRIIEIQGTAERAPLEWNDFDAMMVCARQGIKDLFACIEQQQSPGNAKKSSFTQSHEAQSARVPMFSLKARFKTPQEQS